MPEKPSGEGMVELVQLDKLKTKLSVLLGVGKVWSKPNCSESKQ